MNGRVAIRLLATLVPGSQSIIGRRVAGCTIIAVDFWQVSIVADTAVDQDVEVRARLPISPCRIIVGTVGKNRHGSTTRLRAVIEVTMDLFKRAVTGDTAVTNRFSDSRNRPQAGDSDEQ